MELNGTRIGEVPEGARTARLLVRAKRVRYAVTVPPEAMATKVRRFALGLAGTVAAGLSDDTERAQFIAENRQVRSLKVFELPLEYAAAETGQAPTYLYRFWIDTDPVMEWRLTGFSWDLEIDGQLWPPKQITHGQIQRSTRADMPDFSIECERDPDIPVIHLVPPALSLPLNVEVRESLSPADTGNVIAIRASAASHPRCAVRTHPTRQTGS